jgi:hypothetical protein
MPIDRKSPLPKEVHETVAKWMGQLTEELKTKFDLGFRPGVYFVYTVDKDELPDGVWVLFQPQTRLELAYSFVETSYEIMRKAIDSGIIERLEILRKHS